MTAALLAKPPIAQTVRELQLATLLRETLPYLKKVELGPSTSAVLRSLIQDIEQVTK